VTPNRYHGKDASVNRHQGNLGLVNAPTSKFLIYGLFDPRDGQLRYVGKSTIGLERPKSHYSRSLKGHEGQTYKTNWIMSLSKVGLRPEVEVLEELPTPNGLDEAEIFHIAYYRSLGCSLTNLTDGGDGCWGRRNPSKTIKKMSGSAFRRWGKSAPIDTAKLVERYLSGLTLRDVAMEFNTSSSTVFTVLKREGVRVRDRKEARRRHGIREPSAEEIQTICFDYAGGKSSNALACELKIPCQRILRILRQSGVVVRSNGKTPSKEVKKS
jgi:hypothetical protein